MDFSQKKAIIFCDVCFYIFWYSRRIIFMYQKTFKCPMFNFKYYFNDIGNDFCDRYSIKQETFFDTSFGKKS